MNGLSTQNNLKSETLMTVIKDHNFSYFGVQELNLHDKILQPNEKWKRKFFNVCTESATNQHSTSQRRILYGGTAHFLDPHLSLRQLAHGCDPTNLGRWIWTLLQGRQGTTVRIITGYRPIEDRSNRPHTVFSQHEYYFNEIAATRGYRNPRQAFYEDLNEWITKWTDEGDSIILGLDANEDIHSGDTKDWIESWGLRDVMQTSHPQLERVATCSKNLSNIPIDGIWCSPGLSIHKAGMTGFGELYPDSDHRILWMDIAITSLFGFRTPAPDKRPTDSLPVRNPLAMKKYNKYVKAQFAIHKIAEKTFLLEQKAQDGTFTDNDALQLDRILHTQYNIRTRAKKQCRRFYTSQIPYTDALGKIYRRRKLWKLMELKRQNVKVDIKAIRRLMRQVNEPDAFRLSFQEVQARLQRAISDWKDHKKNQHELREQFELKVDRQRAIKFGTSVDAQSKQRKNSGSTRAIFKKIKSVMKPTDRTAISTVEYTADNGNIIECLSRESIESACAAEGQRRFSQSRDTPFLQGSLLHAFGYNASPKPTQEVLNGTFVAGSDVSEITKQFLQELTMPSPIRDLPPILGTTTTKDHCQGWQKMRARTGSSPYGPLFCDYIAGTHDAEVAEVDAALSSIPYLAGFSPSQWQKASDVMIPKKKTSRHVEKLRIIVLFDAMFNMVNKRIARNMIQRAMNTQIMPDEAYGGVPGRRASTCSLNKILALDIIRMERRVAAVCSNDAKSCYDRIIHTVASICMQRLGVSQEACFTMFGTLQELTHHVRTAFGEKAHGYGAVGIPLHGVGQGNGAGPAIWLAITIPLISLLKKAGFGLQLVTPITHEKTSLACFVYVDDVDSIHAPMQNDGNIVDVAADMQRMLDTWAGGLHATGGMIEPTKSYWYLIDFKWNQRRLKWEYKSIHETPATIFLRHPGAVSIPLQRKEVWEPDQDGTLGTFIAMDGNQRMVAQSLQKQVDEWADKIRTRQLSSTEAWLSLRSGISMSIQHQLSTSRLSKSECRSITKKLKQAALKASGIPTTFPDALVYSPKEFMGLGLPDLWHIQAMLFAEQCLRYGSIDTDPTGLLLRTVIQLMRIEMGVSRSPLGYPFQQWKLCVTPNQFLPFWEYASETHLELRDGLTDLPTARQNDQFLMEMFSNHGVTPTQLRLLNLCRLYLRIYLLSDLTMGSGEQLDPTLLARRHPFHHHTEFRWPKTHMPNNHCWRMWTETIIKCCTMNHLLHPYSLTTPLGKWFRHNKPLKTDAMYSPRVDAVYQLTTRGTYIQFQRIQRRDTRHHRFSRTIEYPQPPADSIPTTLHGARNEVQHTGISSYIDNPSSTNTPDWWGIVISRSLSISDLVYAIQQGTAIAVTDGSFKDGMGTAAFTFRTSGESRRSLTFVHMTPGIPDEMSPYRAEVGGLFGIAAFLDRISKSFDCRGGKIIIACDCKGALDRAFSSYPPVPKQPNFDLYSEIFRFRSSSQIQWEKKWVKGHQDNTTAIQDLDCWARINIEMDTLAKYHWMNLDRCRPRPFSLPPSKGIWSLWHQGRRLQQWDKTVANQIYFNTHAQTYWAGKHAHFPALDYEAIRQAYKSTSLFYQLRAPKWFGRKLPVGTRVSLWSSSASAECPRCGAPNENHLHIVQCTHPGAVALAAKWLDQLNLWLAKQHTHPTLRSGVISILKSGFENTLWTPPFTADPIVHQTFRKQQEQGHQSVMFGWWAKGWAEVQHAYSISISRRTTGRRWLSRLIKKQWEISWDMWRHRLGVAASTDSFSLALAHERINSTIREVYAQISRTTYPPLQRWVRQPLTLVLEQNLTFKKDWLHVVRSFTVPHDHPTSPEA